MSNYTTKAAGKSYLPILWIVVILDLTFQIFNYLPLFQRHYLFWFIGFVLIFLYSRYYFRSPSFFWMAIYLLIVVLNCLWGDHFFNSLSTILTREAINFIFPVAFTYYLFRSSNYHLFKLLMVFFGFFLIESSIVSVWANYMYPGLMRLQASAEMAAGNASILDPFKAFGLSDYNLPHAIPALIPGLVYALRESRKIQRLLFLVILVSSIALAYASTSFTALFLTLTSLIMSILISKDNVHSTKLRLVLVGFFVIPFAFSIQLQSLTVRAVQSFFPEESIISRKLADIDDSILYGDSEGAVDNRATLYEKTFYCIAENPIFGTDDDSIGGHSAIPDRIAALGIIGFIPYVLFIFFQMKFTCFYIKGPKRFYLYVGLVAALVMLTVKGVHDWSIWLFLLTLLPGLLWWIGDQEGCS